MASKLNESDPQTDTSQSNKPSTEDRELPFWRNADIQKFKKVRREKRKLTEEILFAEELLTFLFTGDFTESFTGSVEDFLRDCILMNASFLRSPKNPNEKLFEELDVNVDLKKYFENDRNKFNERSFLNKMPTRDSVNFRKSLLDSGMEGIVRFASFLAVILLRILRKPHRTVLMFIKYQSMDKYNEYFPNSPVAPFGNGAFFLPGKVFGIFLDLDGTQGRDWLMADGVFSSLFAGILSTSHNSRREAIRDFLWDLVLRDLKFYGLRLLRDYNVVSRKYLGMKMVEMKKYLPPEETEEIVRLLEEFEEFYDGTENLMWPWSRLLDRNYFLRHNMKHHVKFGVFLLAISEFFDNGGVWYATFLHKYDFPQVEIDKIKDFAAVKLQEMIQDKPEIAVVLEEKNNQ